MTEALCYGRYPRVRTEDIIVPKEGAGAYMTEACDKKLTAACPLQTRSFKKLVKEPCCFAIFIPARFLAQAKADVKKAAQLYVAECF